MVLGTHVRVCLLRRFSRVYSDILDRSLCLQLTISEWIYHTSFFGL